jgi:uncharacterized protein YaaN involved in tellurite resistance
MVTDDKPNGGESNDRSLVPTPPTALAVVPKEIDAAEAAALQQRAAEIVKQLEDASGSREMELLDSLTAVGIQAQRSASADLELLRARVGDMLSDEGAESRVTKDLVDLRQALNDINPSDVGRSPIERLLHLLPGGDKLVDVLERIAVRYEAVSKQVVIIERRLEEGRMMLVRDNIELRKLYEQVESQQLPLKRNIYLGELLLQQLEALAGRTDDPRKKDRVQSAQYDVSVRVQDLRTMEEVNNQFFVSIEMTRDNNTRLGQAVERTLSIATNTLMVGLAIQSALARQKRVLEATERTREFLGELITANAAAIKRHTTEIGDVMNNPVIAIEKLQQAHNDLIEALDTASRLRAEGIENAKANIQKLAQLSAQLEQKVSGLAAKDQEQKSLEA